MTGSSSRPTRAWLVRWTIIIAIFLALPLLGFSTSSKPAAITLGMIGIAGMLIAGIVIADKPASWLRFLPAMVAVFVVGLWPLYLTLVGGNSRLPEIFLLMVGMMGGIAALSAAHAFVRRRRWVIQTPLRSRLSTVVLLVMVANTFVAKRWAPTNSLRLVPIVLLLAVQFWPSRASLRRAALPPPSPRRPA